VLCLERLRTAESDPIALMHNYVPASLLDIEREELEQAGLYEVFRESGITPHIATQRVGARKAGAEEVELLEIEPGDPVLTMTRIAYDTDGRPIEYGSHSYPAESYWFEMVLAQL
jgi:GntR family transcriptional regulator